MHCINTVDAATSNVYVTIVTSNVYVTYTYTKENSFIHKPNYRISKANN